MNLKRTTSSLFLVFELRWRRVGKTLYARDLISFHFHAVIKIFRAALHVCCHGYGHGSPAETHIDVEQIHRDSTFKNTENLMALSPFSKIIVMWYFVPHGMSSFMGQRFELEPLL